MIITQRRVVFVKLPRTGGTSLHSALTGALKFAEEPYIDALNVNRLMGRGPAWGRHLPVSDTQQLLGDNYGRTTFFTLVRDPIQRLISVYRWQHSKAPDNPVHTDFATFVKALLAKDERVRRQGRLHSRKQRWWLNDREGNLPERLVLIPAEQAKNHLTVMSELVGIPVTYTLDRANVSPSGPVNVPDYIRGRIREEYAEDFDLHEEALAHAATTGSPQPTRASC